MMNTKTDSKPILRQSEPSTNGFDVRDKGCQEIWDVFRHETMDMCMNRGISGPLDGSNM